ncbi:MAG: 2-C-methyl-D-erythritol 2,4-cyclodiphosphate synthase [Chloroflexi bacterium]|nr:2-C-methyl-D-erythritol 2,4-cyclodiphosphate synthase [Chloroflexota bacterium]
MRVGIGHDVHPLVPGRKLIIGGIDISFEKGLAGHSDADVLLHAIMDALLGATALGDIGQHFPPSDIRYKDISSLLLLKYVKDLLVSRGWRIGNIDATIIAERPRLAAHIDDMRRVIGETLELDSGRVSIKATTSEGLGFAGRGEGIAAQAVALITESL